MGGKAFSHGLSPLSTPRIPPATYKQLREIYVTLLATLYSRAVSPICAPEKSSHGDIDILVTGPLTPTSFASLPSALNAHSSLPLTRGSRTFAVPYPDSPDEFVQLGIHVCPAATFDWELFTQSHGDLWNLIGSGIRRFGLTANDICFHVRIAEIEEFGRKKSMLLLTSDPSRVLEFLGLDAERYWREFETLEELYTYVAGMRLFRWDSYIRETLKANDRKRVKQRPLFRNFLEEWLPQQQSDENLPEWDGASRVEVLEEALGVFGKRGEYEQRLEDWRKEQAELCRKREANKKRWEKAKGESR